MREVSFAGAAANTIHCDPRTARIAAQQLRIRELEATVAALRARLSDDSWRCVSGADRSERILLELFHSASPGLVTPDEVSIALHRGAHRHKSALWQQVSRLRAKLAPHGVAIETIKKQGWRIGLDGKFALDALRARLAPDTALEQGKRELRAAMGKIKPRDMVAGIKAQGRGL